MYELFCGQPMFRGRSFGEYVRKHLTEMPVPPRQTPGGADIDPRLEALILKCLEKDPNERFSHILELRDALLIMLGGIETHPPGFASLTASGVRPPPMPTLPLAPMPRTCRRAAGHRSVAGRAAIVGRTYLQYSQHSQIAAATGSHRRRGGCGFAGGAVAVALGIGAAVWYAGRGDTPRGAPVASSRSRSRNRPHAAGATDRTRHRETEEARGADGFAAERCAVCRRQERRAVQDAVSRRDRHRRRRAERQAHVHRQGGRLRDGVIVVDLAAPQAE